MLCIASSTYHGLDGLHVRGTAPHAFRLYFCSHEHHLSNCKSHTRVRVTFINNSNQLVAECLSSITPHLVRNSLVPFTNLDQVSSCGRTLQLRLSSIIDLLASRMRRNSLCVGYPCARAPCTELPKLRLSKMVWNTPLLPVYCSRPICQYLW